MEHTILLTGTIDPNIFNSNGKFINIVLADQKQRLHQYEEAIKFYITDSPFTAIVFAENSGYPFSWEKYKVLARKHGKRFEYVKRHLSVEQVQQMQIRGKSYGEADLINYAMNESILINESNDIYKVTGRVLLRNADQILRGGA